MVVVVPVMVVMVRNVNVLCERMHYQQDRREQLQGGHCFNVELGEGGAISP